MIILDENFPESQRQLLRGWRVPLGQIGYEVDRKGMQDEELIPFFRHRRRPTFSTLDLGFYRPQLCHARYCLACVDVGQYEAAANSSARASFPLFAASDTWRSAFIQAEFSAHQAMG